MKTFFECVYVSIIGGILVAGCAGYDRVLFVTKTNFGLDIDTQPPTLEASIARRELAIQPTYQDTFKGEEKTLPMLASFGSEGSAFNPELTSLFAGGEAAVILATDYEEIKKGCDLRRETADNNINKEELIDKFKVEFESKKNLCTVLIVAASKNRTGESIIAGYNDAGEFKTSSIRDAKNEFAIELQKGKDADKEKLIQFAMSKKLEIELQKGEYADQDKLVKLATSFLGRTYPGNGTDYTICLDKEPNDTRNIIKKYFYPKKDSGKKICNLHRKSANNNTEIKDLIVKFKGELKSKKGVCEVLIVEVSKKLIIAGYSDAGEFITKSIEDANNELVIELQKGSKADTDKLITLAASNIGHTETGADPRPFYFATDTTFGAKVGWDGVTSPAPSTLKVGYNRKEFAYPPIFVKRGCMNGGSYENDKWEVKSPSFLAWLDNSSKFIEFGKSGVKHTQFFATGQAASAFARREAIHKEAFIYMAPDAARTLDKENSVSYMNNSLIKEINKKYEKLTKKQCEQSLRFAFDLGLIQKKDIKVEDLLNALKEKGKVKSPVVSYKLNQLRHFMIETFQSEQTGKNCEG